MFQRTISPSLASSFFLFGPRGTGKSTFLKNFLPKNTTFIDLLDPSEEDLFNRRPTELMQRLGARPSTQPWVVIDEIQKAPRLLDLVHQQIEKGRRFALTGSSARKLKRGGANLLAGRAFVYDLYPLTQEELGDSFRLEDVLAWGSLPRLFQFNRPADKAEHLRSYALTYLKEEIVAEQLVRNLTPFRNFLEVAAQSNGQVLNFSKIAADVGADVKSVQSYFSILEETLVGFLLPAFHLSVRKRQRAHPKFYFFDLGVKRALERTLDQKPQPQNFSFGFAFEHFLILEIYRRARYRRRDWTFSYFQTTDGGEIDLVIERPGAPRALVEIKSTERVVETHVKTLERVGPDIPQSQSFCFSLDPHPKKIGRTTCLPWEKGLVELGI